MARKLPGLSESSAPRRCPRSRTARSPRRSTSRSGSSPLTRSASRPWSCCRRACSSWSSRFLRRGHGGDPGDGRRRHLRPPRVQRPGRLHDRLGALPRLPDRDRARRALRAALPRWRARDRERSQRQPVGRRRRRRPSIAAIAVVRLVRRPGLYRLAIGLAVLDLVTQLLLVVLGLRLLFSPDALDAGRRSRHGADAGPIAFALPLAMLAYTGLETVANLAEEAREPGRRPAAQPLRRDRRRRRSSTSRSPSSGSRPSRRRGKTDARRTEWLRAPLVGIASRSARTCPPVLADALRVFVGVSGALVLLAAATTSDLGLRAARLLARRARTCSRAPSGA